VVDKNDNFNHATQKKQKHGLLKERNRSGEITRRVGEKFKRLGPTTNAKKRPSTTTSGKYSTQGDQKKLSHVGRPQDELGGQKAKCP